MNLRALVAITAGTFVLMGANCQTTNPGMTPPFQPIQWTQIYGDSANSGFNPVHTVPATRFNLKWSAFVGPTPISSPVVAPNGIIYVTTTTNGLVGISPHGSLAMYAPFPDDTLLSTPAVDSFGDLYFVASRPAGSQISCRLVRMAPNGNVLNEVDVPATSASPKVAGDWVFLACPNEILVLSRQMEILDRTLTYGCGETICSSGGVFDRAFGYLGGFLWVLGGCATLDCGRFLQLNHVTAQPRTPSLAVTLATALTNPGEPLIVACEYPCLGGFVFRNNRLERFWSALLDSDLCDDDTPAFTTPTIVLGGVVLVGYTTKKLAAFDSQTGQRLWSTSIGHPVIGTPATGISQTYVATSETLFQVDMHGGIVNEVSLGAGGFSAPITTLDNVFVAGADGVYSFGLDLSNPVVVDGALTPYSDPAVDANGTLYVLSQDGYLQAYGGEGFAAQLAPPPEVMWQTPAQNAILSYATIPEFHIAVANEGDAAFDGRATFSSDLDGVLCDFHAVGPIVTCQPRMPLREGTHHLTATITTSRRTMNAAQFTVQVVNTPPTVTIHQPTASEIYSDNQMFGFSATVTDPDEPAFPPDHVQWRSNLSGDIGSGLSFMRILPAGHHTVTARATDARGAVTEASVNITVVVN